MEESYRNFLPVCVNFCDSVSHPKKAGNGPITAVDTQEKRLYGKIGLRRKVMRTNTPPIHKVRLLSWVGRLGAVLFCLLVFAPASRAFAHGGENAPPVAQTQIAPDVRVQIWTTPAVLRPGEIHIETLVTDPAGDAITDCVVMVQVTPEAEAPTVYMASPALPESFFRHEAALHLEQPGRYDVTVVVKDAQGVGGEVRFPLEIAPVSHWMQGLIYSQLLVAALAAVWLIYQGGLMFRRRLSGLTASG